MGLDRVGKGLSEPSGNTSSGHLQQEDWPYPPGPLGQRDPEVLGLGLIGGYL